ncbi:MAG: putative lipoxygenase [Terrestrivirus sp.]|uniref:Putative lipoxygenase n=1 Tax=Terrestrivirus sp. TaxID=2487775 RepID=A0A3G4ZMS9_9VIRU|nr:MAG: putative lipoxygenase [Terrestrivirus sp.]
MSHTNSFKNFIDELTFGSYILSYNITESKASQNFISGMFKLLNKMSKQSVPTLPQDDKDPKKRYVELNINKYNYPIDIDGITPMTKFNWKTYLLKEFSLPQVVGLGFLSPVISNRFLSRDPITEDDVKRLLKKFKLPNNTDRLNENNVYLKKNAYESLKYVSDDERSKYGLPNDNNVYYVDDFLDIEQQGYFFPTCGVFIKNADNSLTLINIIIIYNGYDLRFDSTSKNWNLMMKIYNNSIKNFGSSLVHQMCSNQYIYTIFMNTRRHLHEKHPISKLLSVFFDGLYFTQKTFSSLGFTDNQHQTDPSTNYVGSFLMFDIQNSENTIVETEIYKTYGWQIMRFKDFVKNRKVDELNIPQLSIMLKLYDIFHDFVKGIVQNVYDYEDKILEDYELINWLKENKKVFPDMYLSSIDHGKLTSILTDIIFASSVRHWQSHVNSYYMYNVLDFPRRGTRMDYIFGDLLLNKQIDDDTSFTTLDFYHYFMTIYVTSAVLEKFDDAIAYLFRNDKVKKEIVNKFRSNIKNVTNNLERTDYTELFFRLQIANYA